MEDVVVVVEAEGGGGECLRWRGVLCFSFIKICLNLDKSVGFPGLGPWTTATEGFLSSSFFDPLVSITATSFGTRSAMAFQ